MFNPFKILCFTCKHCSDIHDHDRTDGISAETSFYCNAYQKELYSFRLRCRNYEGVEDEKYTNAEMIAKQLFTMEEYDTIADLFDCNHSRPPFTHSLTTDCWNTDCSKCKSEWLSKPVKDINI